MRVRAAQPQELGWLCQRTGCAVTPLATAIAAVDGAGCIRGMVGYDCWAPNCVQVHQAMDSAMAARALWRPALEYPFQQLGLGLLVGFISAHNTRALRLATKVGFRETYRIRDGCRPGDDILLLELRREAWLKTQNREAA